MTKLSEKTKRSGLRGSVRRLTALFLAAVLVLGLMYIEAPKAEAVYWGQSYLDKLVSWGVMRGDIYGNLNPERDITRAEFVSMINRAYGYSDVASTPFTDVYLRDWYYEDIGIAYGTGYFSGTTPTTASPGGKLTREQAVVLLGRNMRMEPTTGEAVSFKDSREFSPWSRGMIEATANYGIVSGFDDGTFKPTKNITRGEVAALLVRALGTLVNKEGSTSLGNVYGNVTISSTGVTLKDTTIAGDLYLTGGVGLGSVMLENVKVLGKIIVSGAGESHEGDRSIVLRNTTADNLTVDSIKGQFVTISADGDTKIGTTSVKTLAYLEDLTRAGFGFDQINFNGQNGSSLQIAGNIKSVKNLTPGSTIILAQGTAAEVTIDEYARNSTLRIETGAWVQKLNLDTGATVTGFGDIDELIVNSDGSTISIIPDDVNVRPGVSTNINGSTMDSSIAAEFSQDPRLLAGYPQVKNIAPTTADAVFSSNKSGTVYWAVSAVADGSVSEADLINPPTYGGFAVLSGNTAMVASNSEVKVPMTKLTTGGSYYLSTVFVDGRGQRSPVKVVSFTTPDNTVPAFTTGYPYMSKITNSTGQVAVMTTKSCQLYYALLPKNSSQPSTADFKANAVAGNLGFGTMEVTKNTPALFYVNGRALDELESYDLYLWLTDFDGAKSSAVKKLTFKTVDMTPPEFVTEPYVSADPKLNSVALRAAINEQGTIYWAVVKEGEEYPKPLAGQTVKPALNSDTAKLQVASGMNCLVSGKQSAKANTEVSINVTKLEPEKAYDFYYLAQDSAGNYSEWVKLITVHTLDDKAPTAWVEFTKTTDQEGTTPLPDTDVRVVFSEGIQDINTNRVFYRLYQTSIDMTKSQSERDQAKKDLKQILESDIQLIDVDATPEARIVPIDSVDKAPETGHWICYEDLEITMEEGKTVFIFKNGKNISLNSGGTYYFQLYNIADTYNNPNVMQRDSRRLENFTTVFAQVRLREGASGLPGRDGIRTDMSFVMYPTSTQSASEVNHYDILLWSDQWFKYNLYARVVDSKNSPTYTKDGVEKYYTADDEMFKTVIGPGNDPADDGDGWILLGENKLFQSNTDIGKFAHSIQAIVLDGERFSSHKLNNLKEELRYEFAIHLTEVGGEPEDGPSINPTKWSDTVYMGVTVAAGESGPIKNLSDGEISQARWDTALATSDPTRRVSDIATPSNFNMSVMFTDTKPPKFSPSYPKFSNESDKSVDISVMLDRAGTVYYVVAPVVDDNPNVKTIADGLIVNEKNGFYVPKNGSGAELENVKYELEQPKAENIYLGRFASGDATDTSKIKTGRVPVNGLADETFTVTGLDADTKYYAYFVIKGESQYLSKVSLFQFKTTTIETPIVTLYNSSPNVDVRLSEESVEYWALYPNDSLFPVLNYKISTHLAATIKSDYLTGTGTSAAWNAGEKTKFEALFSDKDYDKITVLDMLLTNISPSDQRSVFDVYASESLRQQVLDPVQGQYTDGGNSYTDRLGPTSITKNTTSPYKVTEDAYHNYNFTVPLEKKMKAGTQYYFIAVARNISLEETAVTGMSYGFKALRGVHILDDTPPEVSNSNGIIISATKRPGFNPSEPFTSDPYSYEYSGTVTVVFSEPVYAYINKHIQPIKQDLVSVDGGLVISNFKPSNATEGTTTISFDFAHAIHGCEVVFFNSGTISDVDSNTQPGGKIFVLKFNAYHLMSNLGTQYKIYDPQFEPVWKQP